MKEVKGMSEKETLTIEFNEPTKEGYIYIKGIVTDAEIINGIKKIKDIELVSIGISMEGSDHE